MLASTIALPPARAATSRASAPSDACVPASGTSAKKTRSVRAVVARSIKTSLHQSGKKTTVTRAACEGPRDAGIDGQCESSHEADSCCKDFRHKPKEAEGAARCGTARRCRQERV